MLAKPRQALAEANQLICPAWVPRLSVAGNRFSKQLARLLDQLARMESWLNQQSRAELRAWRVSPRSSASAEARRRDGERTLCRAVANDCAIVTFCWAWICTIAPDRLPRKQGGMARAPVNAIALGKVPFRRTNTKSVLA